MFIYEKGADVPFVANGATTVLQQQEAYDKFVASSPYLSKHKGQYAERNSALTPWFNRVDGRLMQDIYIKSGNTRHTLQFIVDVINVPNLLNRDWGIRQQYTVNNPLNLKGISAGGSPTFTMADEKVNNVFQPRTEAFSKVQSFSTTWGMQLGLRYTF